MRLPGSFQVPDIINPFDPPESLGQRTASLYPLVAQIESGNKSFEETSREQAEALVRHDCGAWHCLPESRCEAPRQTHRVVGYALARRTHA